MIFIAKSGNSIVTKLEKDIKKQLIEHEDIINESDDDYIEINSAEEDNISSDSE